MPAGTAQHATRPAEAGPQPDVVLKVDALARTFQMGQRQVQALDAVSLTARRGMVTGLIGPDGAGKTTLMRLIVGLLRPDDGSLTVLGMDAVHDAARIQATVGYMPQRFGLYEDLTVQENLDLYADLQGVKEHDRPARYDELMKMTGLAPFTKRLAGRLSGGMKQKLGLACILVRPAPLLILDEPTVGVDPVSRRELWAIVSRLVEEQGMSVLLSTAYLDEAERCDEVILIHDGHVLGQGPPGDFSAQVEGRAYTVAAPDIGKRQLQEMLADKEEIVDALIQGEHIRIVTQRDVTLNPEELLPDVRDVELSAVPARFEDSFIAILRERMHHEAGQAVKEMRHHTVDPEVIGDTVIRVEHAQRRFGDFYAVRDVTFEVSRGEVFGLLGANGAGKSTTFRMLCGLLPASGGHLTVAGVDLRHAASRARSHIGYMSQKFSLYGNLSIQENLNFFSSAYNLHGRKRAERIRWAIEEFELEEMRDAASADLPLGFKQRLSLACALMHEPSILFLDEPTSGVDPLARRDFWRRINALSAQGVTVLVTTHFMEEAEYCDRLAIMVQGEILALGTPTAVKEQSRNEDHPEPTMEDAFINLIEGKSQESNAS